MSKDDDNKDKPAFDDYLNEVVQAWAEEAAMGDQPMSSQCRVCKDPIIRDLVNNLIAHGYTIPDMLATLDKHNLKMRVQGQPEITKPSLYNHRKEHFDIQSPAYAIWRKVQEQHQEIYQQDWEGGVGGILNALSYYQTMMMRGYETLVNPKALVTVDQGAWAAGKLDALMARNEDQYDRAQQLAEMGRIVEVVRAFVPNDDWPKVQAVLRGDVELEATQEEQAEFEMVNIADEDDE
jgi:hypothetical protein